MDNSKRNIEKSWGDQLIAAAGELSVAGFLVLLSDGREVSGFSRVGQLDSDSEKYSKAGFEHFAKSEKFRKKLLQSVFGLNDEYGVVFLKTLYRLGIDLQANCAIDHSLPVLEQTDVEVSILDWYLAQNDDLINENYKVIRFLAGARWIDEAKAKLSGVAVEVLGNDKERKILENMQYEAEVARIMASVKTLPEFGLGVLGAADRFASIKLVYQCMDRQSYQAFMFTCRALAGLDYLENDQQQSILLQLSPEIIAMIGEFVFEVKHRDLEQYKKVMNASIACIE